MSNNAENLKAGSPGDLHFGIFALQMDFINRDQLVAALNAGAIDRSRSVAQILREQGALDAADCAILENVVARHLAKYGGDAEKSLAALAGAKDRAAEVTFDRERAPLSDHDPTVAAAAAAAADPDQTVANPSFEAGADRFHVLRLHDRGGLGEVFVALDRELNREVALKRIREEHADNPQGRARFVVEAEITGNLEHPGVVAVYSLGHGDSGRPYYAMRFIKGENLRLAADHFHRTDREAPNLSGARVLELRRLLGRFLDVCDTIEYAHSRGVIHRDIKPVNVMLGKYGETLVVDWGLAKSVGRPDTALGTADSDGTLAPGFSSSLQPTVTGSRIGTPAYMSPEQAAGRLEEMGPASDVYSLGATLYYLLVGKAPFEGQDLPELLRRVERGLFPSPRSLNPRVDPALESICLKAMSTDPATRYQSARALATEVEHWLAEEPVSTYHEPVALRLRRWARRHRTLVATGAALLQTTVVVLAVSTWLLNQSRARIDRERRVAVDAQHLAEQERQTAHTALKRVEAVNSFLVKDLLEQANPELGGGGGTMSLSDLLGRSVAALDSRSTLGQQPDVEAAIRGTIGDAYSVIGDPKQAVEQLRKAKELLLRVPPSEPLQSIWVANRLANALYFADSLDEALKLYRQTVEQAKSLLGPAHPETAYALGGIGTTLLALGHIEESVAYTREATAALERTLGPADRRTQSEINNLMLALANHNELDEALALGRRLLALREESLGSGHLETVYSRHNLARVLLQKGMYTEALPLEARAVDEITKLLGPNNFRTLFMTNNLGAALEGTGQLAQAEATLRKTLAERRKIHGDMNSNTQRTIAFLARLLMRREKPESIDLLRELIRLRRGRSKPDPMLDRDLDRLPEVLVETAEPSVSEPLLRELITALERAFWPGDWFAAHARSLLGGCLLRQGRRDEAQAILRESLKTMQAARITPKKFLDKASDRVSSLEDPAKRAQPQKPR